MTTKVISNLTPLLDVCIVDNSFYVPASYIMYLSDFCRFLLCTCEWERRGERRAGEGEGARERGIECILYRYS
jgi:hypothetical protein